MPSTPKAPTFDAQGTAQTQANYNAATAGQTFDYSKLAAQLSQQYNIGAFKDTMAQNTMGQETPYGSLAYTTSIDPITGAPKYTAKTTLSPEQQAILNNLQSNQMGLGATAGSAINNTFGQYTGDPNLVGQAGSLTNQALAQQLPAWERFDAPARDQLRTQLLNQGLKEDSPAYLQARDKLIQQQDLDRGAWLSDFQPKAFNEAQTQYQTPLNNVLAMLTASQPGSLKSNLLSTPTGTEGAAGVQGATVGNVDYGTLASKQFDAQTQAWQAQIARQNALMGMGVNAVAGLFGMPVNLGGTDVTGNNNGPRNTFGGQILTNMFLK